MSGPLSATASSSRISELIGDLIVREVDDGNREAPQLVHEPTLRQAGKLSGLPDRDPPHLEQLRGDEDANLLLELGR